MTKEIKIFGRTVAEELTKEEVEDLHTIANDALLPAIDEISQELQRYSTENNIDLDLLRRAMSYYISNLDLIETLKSKIEE